MKVENYSKLTVDEVRTRLDSGRLSVDEVRQLETESGKDRKTIWDLLPETETETAAEPDGGPVRVPAGGIDPRLVEERERRREAERDVTFATYAAPAPLDPRLAEIRERTMAEERRLADRDLTQPPERTRR